MAQSTDSTLRVPEMNALQWVWGDLSGETSLVVPLFGEERSRVEEIASDIYPDDRDRVNIAAEVLLAFSDRHGSLLAEGEVIVREWLMRVISFFHVGAVRGVSAKQVVEPDAHGDPVIKDEFRNHNLVLLCGPIGSSATDAFLRKIGRRDLFEKHGLLKMSAPGYWQTVMEETGGEEKAVRDYGVAMKYVSPWNPNRRVVLAAGCHTFGTQGAASVLVTGLTCKQIRSAWDKDPPASRQMGERLFEIRCSIENEVSGEPIGLVARESLVRIVETSD